MRNKPKQYEKTISFYRAGGSHHPDVQLHRNQRQLSQSKSEHFTPKAVSSPLSWLIFCNPNTSF
jgi:hypothetical protein